MNTHQNITFRTREVFGNFKSRKGNDCMPYKLLPYITIDGLIKQDVLAQLGVEDLWGYIYFLWQTNPDIPLFQEMNEYNDMTSPGPRRASAKHFVEVLLKYCGFSRLEDTLEGIKEQLAVFINKFLSDETIDVNISFMDNLFQIVVEKLKDEDSDLSAKYEQAVAYKNEIEIALSKLRNVHTRLKATIPDDFKTLINVNVHAELGNSEDKNTSMTKIT